MKEESDWLSQQPCHPCLGLVGRMGSMAAVTLASALLRGIEIAR